MLNHPGPYHFGPKVVITQIFQYFPLRPFERDMVVRIHLTACMYIHCGETSLIKKNIYFPPKCRTTPALTISARKL